MMPFYNIVNELHKRRLNCVLCTVVETKGSTPLKAGAKMVISENGELYGSIGGGNLEKKVIESTAGVFESKTSFLTEHSLLQQHGMCCGGTVKIYSDFLKRPDRLFIFGSGHVGRALSALAAHLLYEIFVIDSRKQELALLENFQVNKLEIDPLQLMLSIKGDDDTSVAIMTHDHELDRKILAYCLDKNFGYLGMIGSQRKIEVTKKLFVGGGICTQEQFDTIDSPMGIDLGSSNPEEIAVSILAGLIKRRNDRKTTRINNKIIF